MLTWPGTSCSGTLPRRSWRPRRRASTSLWRRRVRCWRLRPCLRLRTCSGLARAPVPWVRWRRAISWCTSAPCGAWTALRRPCRRPLGRFRRSSGRKPTLDACFSGWMQHVAARALAGRRQALQRGRAPGPRRSCQASRTATMQWSSSPASAFAACRCPVQGSASAQSATCAASWSTKAHDATSAPGSRGARSAEVPQVPEQTSHDPSACTTVRSATWPAWTGCTRSARESQFCSFWNRAFIYNNIQVFSILREIAFSSSSARAGGALDLLLQLVWNRHNSGHAPVLWSDQLLLSNRAEFVLQLKFSLNFSFISAQAVWTQLCVNQAQAESLVGDCDCDVELSSYIRNQSGHPCIKVFRNSAALAIMLFIHLISILGKL